MKSKNLFFKIFLSLFLILIFSCKTNKPWDGNRLIVLGIDGISWDVINPLLEKNELPNFKKIIDTGASGTLISFRPLCSPLIWTTIATGRMARHHNILDHTVPYIPGPKRPVESIFREVPAVWNIASSEGRTVGVVGYFATYPPEKINGFLVSDMISRDIKSVYPPDFLGGLEAEISELHSNKQLLDRFFPWNYDPKVLSDQNSPLYNVTKIVNKAFLDRLERDEINQYITKKFFPQNYDLFMTYLRCTDHASHCSWIFYDDSSFSEKPDPNDKNLLKNLIPETYRYMDDFLGEILDLMDDRTNILIISDHGSGPAVGRYRITDPSKTWLTGNHRLDGVFLAAGPDIAHGKFEGITTLDITPIILALLQLPLSNELDGKLDKRIFREKFFDDFPIKYTDKYEITWENIFEIERKSKVDFDKDYLEKLKSLGYIKDDTEYSSKIENDDLDFWSIDPILRCNVLAGEGFLYLINGQIQKLMNLEDLIRQKDPHSLQRIRALISIEIDEFLKTIYK